MVAKNRGVATGANGVILKYGCELAAAAELAMVAKNRMVATGANGVIV